MYNCFGWRYGQIESGNPGGRSNSSCSLLYHVTQSLVLIATTNAGQQQWFRKFFALLAFCTPPGPSPGLATGQLSKKCHECKHHRRRPALAITYSCTIYFEAPKFKCDLTWSTSLPPHLGQRADQRRVKRGFSLFPFCYLIPSRKREQNLSCAEILLNPNFYLRKNCCSCSFLILISGCWQLIRMLE